jgi:hypothetical protein
MTSVRGPREILSRRPRATPSVLVISVVNRPLPWSRCCAVPRYIACTTHGCEWHAFLLARWPSYGPALRLG